MNRTIRTLLATGVLALGSLGPAATASTPNDTAQTPTSAVGSTPNSPDDCIHLNNGDYNACNVDNRGAGDLPYRHGTLTPNDCIRLNHGDYNACNVDNSGAGNLPYMVVSR